MVASARLTDTIDLHEVASTLDLDFEAEQFPGMVYRVGEETHGTGAPKVCLLLFGSGRVVATGARSYDDVVIAMNHIVDDLNDHEFDLWDFNEDDIQVQNIVMTYDYAETLHLHELVLALPFERSEYEPEQFPGLIFRLKETSGVCLIFSSGKCVITGTNSPDEALAAIDELKEVLDTVRIARGI
jgi:transcription initiation factor TFIID TATA-box-binding protein